MKKQVHFPNFPSCSGVVSYKNNFYIIGDDATDLWQLDSNYKKTNHINLYTSAQKRIDKNSKEDLEAITVFDKEGQTYLLAIGSGSTTKRTFGWKINLQNLVKSKLSLAVFYQRLQAAGIKDLNIEGLTSTEQGFILANRGHNGNKKNHLIFTSPNFYTHQATAPITIVKFGFQKEDQFFGISGLSYSFKTGHLYGTLSSEETSSSFTDGQIGNSKVFILQDVLQKQKLSAVNPNIEIDLATIHKNFIGQKIESVCVLKEQSKTVHLLLAADNDNGQSNLFEVEIDK